MNYRHAFHAGNFADVMKHTALLLVLEHLQKKETGFFCLDTHAGRGLYNLLGSEASKTGEANEGVARVQGVPQDSIPHAFLLYLRLIDALNSDPAQKLYPGSPWFISQMMRKQDRALFYEKHPEDYAALNKSITAKNIRSICDDGWHTIKSKLPPLEKRGLVLVDPPFEQEGEFQRLAEAAFGISKRFSTGTALLWYPIKGTRDRETLVDAVKTLGLPALCLELHRQRPNDPKRLDGSGLIVLNPPWGFDDTMAEALAWMSRLYSTGAGATSICKWVVKKT